MIHSEGFPVAMQFETLRAMSEPSTIDCYHTNRLYSLEKQGGVYRRVSRVTFLTRENDESVAQVKAWFEGSIIYLERATDIEEELAMAGQIVPSQAVEPRKDYSTPLFDRLPEGVV